VSYHWEDITGGGVSTYREPGRKPHHGNSEGREEGVALVTREWRLITSREEGRTKRVAKKP